MAVAIALYEQARKGGKKKTCQDRFSTVGGGAGGGRLFIHQPQCKITTIPLRKVSQLKAAINTVINAVLMFGDGEGVIFLT